MKLYTVLYLVKEGGEERGAGAGSDPKSAPFKEFYGRDTLNPFTTKFKKYALPTFQRELYKWYGETWYYSHLHLSKVWKAKFCTSLLVYCATSYMI